MQVGGVTRVNGNLNLSRAIGDLRYKSNAEISPEKQIISAQVGMCWVLSTQAAVQNRATLLRSAVAFSGLAEFPQRHLSQHVFCGMQPDVRRVQLTPADRFLLLACDGIWDVMTNQQVDWSAVLFSRGCDPVR
jgi:protein phosphatase 1G